MDFESMSQAILNGRSTTSRVDRSSMQLGAVRAGQSNIVYGNPSGGHLKLNYLQQRIEVYDNNNKIAVTLDRNGLKIYDTAGNTQLTAISGKLNVGSGTNQITLDATTNKITVGANITIDAAGNKITIGTGIVLDAANNVMTVGGNNVKIDGANQRLLVNDGVNDRVLLGQF